MHKWQLKRLPLVLLFLLFGIVLQSHARVEPSKSPQLSSLESIKHLKQSKIAVYFMPKQFSKSMLDYTRKMLLPDYKVVQFTADFNLDNTVLLTGYDKAYRFIGEGYTHSAIVIGVTSQQQVQLDRARCQQLNNCAKWLYLNTQASPARIKALQQSFFKHKQFASARIDWPNASLWQQQMPELVWQKGTFGDKPFKLVEQAVKVSDVFVLPADSQIINNASIRTILQYLYRQKIPAIGHSRATHIAGSLLSSYANYKQALDAILYYLNQDKAKWPTNAYVCRQSYYFNQNLARSIGIYIDPQKLTQLSDSLNLACYQ